MNKFDTKKMHLARREGREVNLLGRLGGPGCALLVEKGAVDAALGLDLGEQRVRRNIIEINSRKNGTGKLLLRLKSTRRRGRKKKAHAKCVA